MKQKASSNNAFTLANALLKASLITLTALLAPVLAQAQITPQTTTAHVHVVAPNNSPFWQDFHAITEAAAKDLGIEISFLDGESRFHTLKELQSLPSHPGHTEYVVMMYLSEIGADALHALDKAGIKLIFLNNDIPTAERKRIGEPRQRHKNWLAHLYFDDVKVGYELASSLVEAAGLADSAHPASLIAINGPEKLQVSHQRDAGMRMRVAHKDLKLTRAIHTHWDEEHARMATDELLKRYPSTSLIWAANDSLALSALLASKALGRTPGKDIFIGGIDWTAEAVASIAQGELTSSFGGHVFGGAWSLVLIHDYHQGVDFASDLGTEIKLPMREININNAEYYRERLQSHKWSNLDFKQFSKVHTKEGQAYQFVPDHLIPKPPRGDSVKPQVIPSEPSDLTK